MQVRVGNHILTNPTLTLSKPYPFPYPTSYPTVPVLKKQVRIGNRQLVLPFPTLLFADSDPSCRFKNITSNRQPATSCRWPIRKQNSESVADSKKFTENLSPNRQPLALPCPGPTLPRPYPTPTLPYPDPTLTLPGPTLPRPYPGPVPTLPYPADSKTFTENLSPNGQPRS